MKHTTAVLERHHHTYRNHITETSRVIRGYAQAHLPSKAIHPPPSIIEPRAKATLLLEAANISLLNKKSCAMSYSKETGKRAIRR